MWYNFFPQHIKKTAVCLPILAYALLVYFSLVLEGYTCLHASVLFTYWWLSFWLISFNVYCPMGHSTWPHPHFLQSTSQYHTIHFLHPHQTNALILPLCVSNHLNLRGLLITTLTYFSSGLSQPIQNSNFTRPATQCCPTHPSDHPLLYVSAFTAQISI